MHFLQLSWNSREKYKWNRKDFVFIHLFIKQLLTPSIMGIVLVAETYKFSGPSKCQFHKGDNIRNIITICCSKD